MGVRHIRRNDRSTPTEIGHVQAEGGLPVLEGRATSWTILQAQPQVASGLEERYRSSTINNHLRACRFSSTDEGRGPAFERSRFLRPRVVMCVLNPGEVILERAIADHFYLSTGRLREGTRRLGPAASRCCASGARARHFGEDGCVAPAARCAILWKSSRVAPPRLQALGPRRSGAHHGRRLPPNMDSTSKRVRAAWSPDAGRGPQDDGATRQVESVPLGDFLQQGDGCPEMLRARLKKCTRL